MPENRFQNSGNYSSNGAIKYKSVCSPCGKIAERKVKELKKLHPVDRDTCTCCGRKAKLLLDHDHKTGLFRGYICSKCNTGIAFLGDTDDGVSRALNYLRSQ